MGRPKGSGRPTVRVNLDLSPKSKGLLEKLRDRIDAASMSEVVRRALTLYEQILDLNGDGLLLVRKQGEEASQLLLGLPSSPGELVPTSDSDSQDPQEVLREVLRVLEEIEAEVREANKWLSVEPPQRAREAPGRPVPI